jgi:hypothetical protein
VSPQYVGRLLRGDARPQLGGLALEREGGSVVQAVDAFLAGLELDLGALVHAEMARVLAVKLDACRALHTATAAATAPGLARSLIVAVEALRGCEREMGAIDEIRMRRDARRLASGYAS